MKKENTNSSNQSLEGNNAVNKKYVKSLLRRNLKSLMEDKAYSISRLANASGIGRSVVKTYIDDSISLPNIYQLLKIADALDCDLNDLLPSDALRKNQASTKVMVEISESVTVNKKSEEIYNILTHLNGRYLYYAPKTLPEILKTDSILQQEIGARLDNKKVKYFNNIRSLTEVNFSGCILLKSGLIMDLLRLEGIYKNLTPEDMMEQIDLIKKYEDAKFPNVQIKVMDSYSTNVSDILLIDGTIAYHEMFDQVITLTDQKILSSASILMNEKIRISPNFSTFIENSNLI